MYNTTSILRLSGFFICLTFCLFLLLTTGCGNNQPSPDPNSAASPTYDQRQAQIKDLTQITDGILHCLATAKFQWLENYTDTELTGLQVARLLLGDAAFDRVIVGWNSQMLTTQFNQAGDAVIVSIPVTHQARENVKFGPKTSLFNFHFYFSKQQNRWILNFNQLLTQ